MSDYCKSCGIVIPKDQRFCSMCYGDIEYGTDDHYKQYLQDQQELEAQQEYYRQEYYRQLEEEQRGGS
jgi:hypothetical protein